MLRTKCTPKVTPLSRYCLKLGELELCRDVVISTGGILTLFAACVE